MPTHKNLSKVLLEMETSKTMAISSMASKLKNDGVDVANLSTGEPDFDTPVKIKRAAIKAISDGFTRYTSAAGDPSLIDAISNKFKKDNNLSYAMDQIVVSSGAKQSIYNAVMAVCNEGDEVLIPSPCWVTYPALVKTAGAVPILVPGKSGNSYKPTAKEILDQLTPKTKAVVLNSPNNPTGHLYTKAELEQIATIAAKNKIYIVSDEIYEKIVFPPGKHVSIASLGKDINNLTITVNGVSKAYAMTGWRIGFLGCSAEIAGLIRKFQGQTTHHPSTISMKAAEEALAGPDSSVEKMVSEFTERMNYVRNRLKTIPDIDFSVPLGAFYFFIDVSYYYGRRAGQGMICCSEEMCAYLLNKHRVAFVPGSAFGNDGCVRLSFAADLSTLEKAMNRFEQGLKDLE